MMGKDEFVTNVNPSKQTIYLNDSQVAVFSVCAQVEYVPLHIDGG